MNTTIEQNRRSGGFDRALAALQSIGRSLMLPIAVLPAAGLLLRFGQPDMLNLAWMANGGGAIFDNLSLIFAIGIAVGLTGSAGAAGIAGLVGFLVFTAVFNTFIPQLKGAPDTAHYTMGVLSGIIVGLITAQLYKRFHDIRLPDYLGFFGGKRFVPIITALVMLVLGAIFGIIWPTIQSGINAVGMGIAGLGPFGPGLYGFFNRLLIPLGLHHVLNTYIWFQYGSYTPPGGGAVVNGDLSRYFAGDPTAGGFMAGFFPMMMFGLPAACVAMIQHAKFPKIAAGILISSAIAAILTGITEPIEFSFMFVAPILYLVHAILTGTSLFICDLLHIRIGFSFSAGLIDYILNFRKANTSGAPLILLIGACYAVVYYLVFSFFIKVFDLGTPGRGEASTGLAADWILPESQRGPKKGTVAATTALAGGAVAAGAAGTALANGATDPDTVLASHIVDALGGNANIESVEGCITRLRLFVKEPEVIDDALLKSLGAKGIVKRGSVIQVVMGTQSDRIADRMNQILKK